MNRQISLRQLNYSHVVLIAGLVLSLLVVMFRPSGAEAVGPGTVDVFKTSDTDTSPFTVNLGPDLNSIKKVDYKVILKGQKKDSTVALTGIPLVEVLKAGGVNTEKVQFVKIRYGTTDDSRVSLVQLPQGDAARPPIVLTDGEAPKRGPFKTPQIVPGQPDLNTPLSEESFVYFKTGSKVEPIKLIPGAPGANLMRVNVTTSKRQKNGQYILTATIPKGGSSDAKKYEWYGYNANGDPVKLNFSGKQIETKDGTDGNADRNVFVVVTESGGSTGIGVGEYTSLKKQKGTTKNPYPDPTPATGGNTGAGNGAGGGVGLNGGAVNALPTTPTTPDGSQSVVPVPTAPTTAPTDPTTLTESTMDTAAITNAAQNVSGTGGLKTVSGVLLSSPTVAPVAAGGGTPIAALPEPVVDQLNSIFQPVDDVDDAWAYLLALLFAFTFSGAVREWVKP